MGTLKRAITAVALGAVIALSLTANATEALAATTTDTHGVQVEKGGRGGTTSPFDALGITWD